MSIFKDSGIILKIIKQEKNFLYTILSQKFGKIIVSKKKSKKEKNIDLGFHINYEIKTNNNISKILNIKIINEFNLINKDFSQINNYLEMLKLVLDNTAYGVENIETFEILNQINKYNKSDIEDKILLGKLKILNNFGELNILHKDTIISKILKFINENNFSKILKLTGINQKIQIELQKITKNQ